MPRVAAGGRRSGGQQRSRDGVTPGVDAPQALSVTHWFEAESDGEPYAATVRFTGRRIGTAGKPAPGDAFVKEESVDHVVPGSGPVSLTTWVYGVNPGHWSVMAELIRRANRFRGLQPGDRRGHTAGQSLPRAAWSWWRWTLGSGAFTPVRTGWPPLVRMRKVPAVIHGSWLALVLLGVVVGALVQAALLGGQNVAVPPSLVVDAVAVLSGLAAAKAWYVVLSSGSWRQRVGEGWSVDGFLLVTPVVAFIALLAFDLPIGLFFDASTPALFIGVAIGRLGCFLTGCCAGRCTRSRWGVWSSDRRVGARRIPTQLLESGAGLVIAVASLPLVVADFLAVQGVIFVAAVSTYVLLRQFLLRLRAEPHDVIRARLTAATAGLVLAGAVAVLMLAAVLTN